MSAENVESSIPTAQVAVTKTFTLIPAILLLQHLCWCLQPDRLGHLDGDTPIPQPKADAPIIGPTKLISTLILGGLHHRYQPVVA